MSKQDLNIDLDIPTIPDVRGAGLMIEHEVTLPEGTLKRIHVDQHRIKSNVKHGENKPPLTVQAAGGPYKAHEVDIKGSSTIVYDGRTLSCGARCWIETHAEVATVVHATEIEGVA